MMSTDLLFSAATLACGLTLTKVTLAGSSPTFLAKAGHMRRAASPGGLPILRPAKSFGPLMPEDLSQ
ncbi:hypothetical protein D3C72_2026290 [compost metagenome]